MNDGETPELNEEKTERYVYGYNLKHAFVFNPTDSTLVYFDPSNNEENNVTIPESMDFCSLTKSGKFNFMSNTKFLVYYQDNFNIIQHELGKIFKVKQDPLDDSRILCLTESGSLYSIVFTDDSFEQKVLHKDISDFDASTKYMIIEENNQIKCFTRDESSFIPVFTFDSPEHEELYSDNNNIYLKNGKLVTIYKIKSDAHEKIGDINCLAIFSSDSVIIQISECIIQVDDFKMPVEFPVVHAIACDNYVCAFNNENSRVQVLNILSHESSDKSVAMMQKTAADFISNAMKMIEGQNQNYIKRIAEMTKKFDCAIGELMRKSEALSKKIEYAQNRINDPLNIYEKGQIDDSIHAAIKQGITCVLKLLSCGRIQESDHLVSQPVMYELISYLSKNIHSNLYEISFYLNFILSGYESIQDQTIIELSKQIQTQVKEILNGMNGETREYNTLKKLLMITESLTEPE